MIGYLTIVITNHNQFIALCMQTCQYLISKDTLNCKMFQRFFRIHSFFVFFSHFRFSIDLDLPAALKIQSLSISRAHQSSVPPLTTYLPTYLYVCLPVCLSPQPIHLLLLLSDKLASFNFLKIMLCMKHMVKGTVLPKCWADLAAKSLSKSIVCQK